MRSDTRVKANSRNNCLSVKAFYLGISIKFIEIGYAERKISIGKKLDCLSLLHAHEKRIDILLDGALLKQSGKSTCKLLGLRIAYCRNRSILLIPLPVLGSRKQFWITYNDT